MPTTLTTFELRALLAGQIAAAMVTRAPQNTSASMAPEIAGAAVHMATEIEKMVNKSLETRESPPPERPKHTMGRG